ncbi:hypothetical protein ACRAR1_04740 [Streptomyces sanyensis]|uniref:hypothetical protein n=1 Tax=Streptomyces sanyensis TaxID=568869 RepID=UPI003D76CD98
MSTEETHAGAVDRALLEDWPGRFRYPGVLVALTAGQEEAWDATELARSVLARIGGRPPRVVCAELIELGEFDAAEYLLAGCPELREHEAGALGRRLRAARSAAEEDVRQRVAALRRRATAGVSPPRRSTRWSWPPAPAAGPPRWTASWRGPGGRWRSGWSPWSVSCATCSPGRPPGGARTSGRAADGSARCSTRESWWPRGHSSSGSRSAHRSPRAPPGLRCGTTGGTRRTSSTTT